MDHRYALETQATERYLLGELPAVDAAEFELHYFECAQCALAVESGQMFIIDARERLRSATSESRAEADKPRRSFSASIAAFLRPVFAIPVMAVLASILLYQNAVVIPAMRGTLNTVQPLPAVLLIGASRGEEVPVSVPAGSPFVSVAALIPPGTPYKEYVCVLASDGHEISSSVNPAPPEGEPITILIPARRLRGGSQELILFGLEPNGRRSDKISAYPFKVQFN